MAFWDTLSQWLERLGTANGATPKPESTAAPKNYSEVAKRHDKPDAIMNLAVGDQLFLTISGRHFMVAVSALDNNTIRVNFPGIDYPVKGMIADVERHSDAGFISFQSNVLAGPLDLGEGVLLEWPLETFRNRHRDACRVPVDLPITIEVSDGASSFDATMTNLSTGGAMFETTASVALGALLSIRSTLPGNRPVTLDVKVMRRDDVTQSDDNTTRYVYGAAFTDYEAGVGRIVTRYVWERLGELYPSV